MWPDKGFLAASPDGIVYEAGLGTTGLLEIQCPYTKRDSDMTEACNNADFFFAVRSVSIHTTMKCNFNSTAILVQHGVISLHTP